MVLMRKASVMMTVAMGAVALAGCAHQASGPKPYAANGGFHPFGGGHSEKSFGGGGKSFGGGGHSGGGGHHFFGKHH